MTVLTTGTCLYCIKSFLEKRHGNFRFYPLPKRIFADIVNVLLLDGEKKIKPDEFENVAVHSQYRDELFYGLA